MSASQLISQISAVLFNVGSHYCPPVSSVSHHVLPSPLVSPRTRYASAAAGSITLLLFHYHCMTDPDAAQPPLACLSTAVSYDWGKGYSEYNPSVMKNTILLHATTEQEVKPRSKLATGGARK